MFKLFLFRGGLIFMMICNSVISKSLFDDLVKETSIQCIKTPTCASIFVAQTDSDHSVIMTDVAALLSSHGISDRTAELLLIASAEKVMNDQSAVPLADVIMEMKRPCAPLKEYIECRADTKNIGTISFALVVMIGMFVAFFSIAAAKTDVRVEPSTRRNGNSTNQNFF